MAACFNMVDIGEPKMTRPRSIVQQIPTSTLFVIRAQDRELCCTGNASGRKDYTERCQQTQSLVASREVLKWDGERKSDVENATMMHDRELSHPMFVSTDKHIITTLFASFYIFLC